MTDETDTSAVLPDEAGPVAPPQPEHRPWTPEDRRTLLITVGGGLAANIATVVVVAVAIVFSRLINRINSPGLSAAQRALAPKDRARELAALHSAFAPFRDGFVGGSV